MVVEHGLVVTLIRTVALLVILSGLGGGFESPYWLGS